MPSDHSPCPVMCLTKISLFVVTTLFVLYLPLGDPQIMCNTRNVQNFKTGIVFCLCDFYDFVSDVARKTVDIIDITTRITLDGLYKAKLQLYKVLSTFDQDDYCRVGCNSDKDENNCAVKKKSVCKCISRCCRRKG